MRRSGSCFGRPSARRAPCRPSSPPATWSGAEMSDPIRAIVILSDETDRNAVESALGFDPSIEIVGYSDSLDQDWQQLLSEPSDIVIVACDSYSDRAAH